MNKVRTCSYFIYYLFLNIWFFFEFLNSKKSKIQILFKYFKYMCYDCWFSACRFNKYSSANVAGNFTACASENDLFVFTIVTFYSQKSAFRLVCITHFYHSENSNFLALKHFLWCDLLHFVHLYLSEIFLVGLSPPGTLENFPEFPIPVCLFLCLVIFVNVEALPFFTLSITCSSCCLQKGQ